MSSAANPTVRHYRFCTPITGAAHEAYSLVGSEDTSFELSLDTDYCIIIKVGNDGDMSAAGDFQLQVEIDVGGFNDVNATSSNFRSAASGDTEDATSTTERLGTSAETFQTSVLDEVQGLIGQNVGGHDEYEFYFAFNVRSAELSGGESVEFRLTTGGSTFTHNLSLDATVEAGVITASGDGPVPAIEAAGTAKVRKQASGSATLAPVEAAGTALVHRAASGGATLAPVEASGAATVHRAASGAAILVAVMAAGTAQVEINSAAGDGPVPPIEAAGTALVHRAASGSATLAPIEAAGTATIHRAASGGGTLAPIEAAGTAIDILPASGGAILAPVEATGTAKVIHGASGDGPVPTIQAAGTAKVRKVASGSSSLTAIAASGSAIRRVVASGSPSIAAVLAAGSATVRKQASGAASIPTITASGDAGGARVAIVDVVELEARVIDISLEARDHSTLKLIARQITLELEAAAEQGFIPVEIQGYGFNYGNNYGAK